MPGSPDLSGHSQSYPIYPSPSRQEAPSPLALLSGEPLRGPGLLPLCSHLHTHRRNGSSSVKKEAVLFYEDAQYAVHSLPHATPQGPKPGWLANVPSKSHDPGGSKPVPHQPWKGMLYPIQAQPDATQCTRAPSRANTAAGPVFSNGSMRRRHRRRRKASVFLYSRWNFQPKREAYSQPSPSASACLCCRREEAVERKRQGRIPRGKPGRATWRKVALSRKPRRGRRLLGLKVAEESSGKGREQLG